MTTSNQISSNGNQPFRSGLIGLDFLNISILSFISIVNLVHFIAVFNFHLGFFEQSDFFSLIFGAAAIFCILVRKHTLAILSTLGLAIVWIYFIIFFAFQPGASVEEYFKNPYYMAFVYDGLQLFIYTTDWYVQFLVPLVTGLVVARKLLPSLRTGDNLNKKCIYCGEQILAVAKKCKHCGEFLD
jgi:hypothetical protein